MSSIDVPQLVEICCCYFVCELMRDLLAIAKFLVLFEQFNRSFSSNQLRPIAEYESHSRHVPINSI